MQAFNLLSFGCHNLTGGSSLRRSIRLVHCAIDHGIARFDVAPSYGLGTAETVLGIAIRDRSSEIEITTKFGIEPPKLGRLFAWGREPYRYLKRASGETTLARLNAHTAKKQSRVRLMRSLERSLRALGVDHVDTLLTHELIDPALLRENLEDLELAQQRGQLCLFGCSGERTSVERMLSTFCHAAKVIQVSVSDWETFSVRPIVRLFGTVRILKPHIAGLVTRDKAYADGLVDALPGVRSLEDRLALGAMAAARTMFPQSVLLINTSKEARISLIARFLNDLTLTWGEAHRGVHNRTLTSRARS